jgi:predicted Zn-dependent protease
VGSMLALVRRDPRDVARKRVDKAFALIESGKAEEAERLARRYVARRPHDAEAHLALAGVLSGCGPWAEASAVAIHAAELSWDDPSVVYVAAARAVYGDLDAAERLVSRVEALLLQPGQAANFPFHNELLHLNGLIALRRGDPKRARAMLSLAYEAEPTIVGLGFDLANAYVQEDHLEEALAVVGDALTYHPDSERLLKLQREIRHRLEAAD